MNFDPQLTPKKQIRNLFAILSAGIACAFLLTFFMLYSYNPAGQYLLKNALISPEVISQISFEKKNKMSGEVAQAILDKIEFSYQDVETKKTTKNSVAEKTYARFYTMIADDGSMLDIPDDISAGFNQMPATSLTLMIRENPNNRFQENPNQVFQIIEFLYKGDYYRLQLREANGSQWIYFYHPNIYEDTLTLFTHES